MMEEKIADFALPEEVQAILDREREEWRKEREGFRLRELFWKAGGRDAEYLAYRYGKEARFDEDGALLDGEALAEKAKAELPEQFARRQLRLEGVRPQEGGSPSPGQREFAAMDYWQRAELWEKDPEAYRRMRVSDKSL